MQEFDLIVEHIQIVYRDRITSDRPYIPDIPRASCALVYVTDGVLLYSVGGVTYRVGAGSVLVITPGTVDYSGAEGEAVSYIFFDFIGTLPPFSDDALCRVNRPTNPKEILALFEEALQIWQNRAFGYQVYCKALLSRIITQVASCNFNASVNFYKYDRIRPALMYLEQNYMQPLAVSDLAQHCEMSTGNLTRLFGELMGASPMEYLCRIRIENAKRFLRTGAFNVSEVAEKCGFASIYSFSRAFKRLTGVSPRAFRG